MDQKTMAASILLLLQQDPRRYLCFGAYWWLVKMLLKKFYTRDNLSLLGEYIDPMAADRMPPHTELDEALAGAIDEYRVNASFGINSNQVSDLAGGGTFLLVDPDATS